MHDIIPDIHGQADKLEGLLRQLGWSRSAAGWRNDEPHRKIVFLGDFIDRGENNARVIKTVRSLIDAGKASAVMGNHELNAIHFHTRDDDPERAFMRPHTEKNVRQHASFLREYPVGAVRTAEVISWIKTLPLFIEKDGFRAVHACWNGAVIEELRRTTANGVLSEEQLRRAADKEDPLFHLAETTTKGPEVRLPVGHSFVDKDGTPRKHVRVKWWQANGSSWADLAMSVPDPSQLPSSPIDEKLRRITYDSAAKPVFFGHYWLTGAPVLQAPNALCLDYSAGADEEPLVAYRFRDGDQITLQNFVSN